MRKAILVIALAGGLAGCGFFRKTLGVGDSSPAHTSPKTTSIWGSWVLATAPDSTAFVGASKVEMQLDEREFAITASYPTRPTITVRGSVTVSEDGGLVTLDPQTGLDAIGSGGFAWRQGEKVTVVASAAGNTLVFAPPRDNTARPSSVWFRKDAAQKAGGTGTPPPTR
jgi:hypothetical protein